jgi:phosphatidate cytidylyltransferase
MTQFFYTCLIALYCAGTSFSLQYVSYFGRFWYHFPMFCVGWNDASAFFIGRKFGRTRLISLSPKKTVEGFVGALLSNAIVTFMFLDGLLRDNNYWTCAPMRLTWRPFEDY